MDKGKLAAFAAKGKGGPAGGGPGAQDEAPDEPAGAEPGGDAQPEVDDELMELKHEIEESLGEVVEAAEGIGETLTETRPDDETLVRVRTAVEALPDEIGKGLAAADDLDWESMRDLADDVIEDGETEADPEMLGGFLYWAAHMDDAARSAGAAAE